MIKSCKQFSYKDVQRIICNCDEDSEESVEKDVIHLHKISSKLRYQRLENGDLSIPFEDPRLQDVDEDMENPEAHSLVEEFMIITNKYIARRLSQNPKLSSLLILRTQKQPASEQRKEWFSNEGALGHLVMKLQGQKINKSIQLLASCMKEQDDQYVIVQRSLWTKLCYCLQNDNIEEIRKIIFMDNAHSLQCLALQHWLEMMETAEYKCGDGLSKENALHFGLQRLVHADLDGTDVNCTVKEVIQLCQELNTIAARQKAFSKECQALAIADTLRSGPLNFRAYVDELSSDKMVLHVPSLQKVSSRKQELHFNLLGAVQQPEVIAPATKREKVKVHVKPAVYCVRSEDRNELDKRRKYGDLSSPKISPEPRSVWRARQAERLEFAREDVVEQPEIGERMSTSYSSAVCCSNKGSQSCDVREQ
ncbi:hypothetical protein C0Q70_11549 [Pomacea canaliculata]|uniref:RNB domain-containing protein n=1 Tax=Pomacea canaliculata TaxID=400727 RepID=A0A2T7P6D4_POMCA|nr:hypothetical protein C0Q70_11549 [Pomacea canaliculata]